MHFKTCLLSTGTCNFDGGFCEWINLPLGDEFDWTLNSGKTGTMLTGPTEDHTGYQGIEVPLVLCQEPIMPNWKIKKGPLKLIIKTSRVLYH